jgi:mannose-6-phosphate isomerase-like protein (cupin superfamily)
MSGMKIVLLVSCAVVSGTLVAAAGQQAPAQPRPTAPPPQTAKPATPPAAGQPAQPAPKPAAPAAPATGQPATATPAPVRRAPAAPAAGRGGMAITVTTPAGATLPGVHVTLTGTLGSTDRSADTNDSGQLNFPGLQAGTYRLRFAGESVVTYEREVNVPRGGVLSVDVALNPAPKPPPPPPPPAPAPVVAAAPKVVTGPTGQPQSLSVVELLEKDFVGRNPRRESLLSCSGTTRTTMLQVNEPLPERMYADADVVYYVLGGEGSMRLNGKESNITTNGFLSVPRGASHSFTRRGNRPLVLLAVLGGEPCEMAK